MTPAERSLRARLGAHALHAKHDPRETTAAARDAARSKLDARLADEHGIDLDAPDAARRLEHARRAHFSRLALKAARARRLKRERAAEIDEVLDDLSEQDGDDDLDA
jgi:hypothetical protein